MISEMKKENLVLLKHITENSKSSLEYNVFVVNKFMVKKSNQIWWKRLLNKPDRVHTPDKQIKFSYSEILHKIKRKLYKLFRFAR